MPPPPPPQRHDLRRLGVDARKEHVRWLAETIDAEGDGSISYQEFVRAVQEPEAEEGFLEAEVKGAHRRQTQGTH